MQNTDSHGTGIALFNCKLMHLNSYLTRVSVVTVCICSAFAGCGTELSNDEVFVAQGQQASDKEFNVIGVLKVDAPAVTQWDMVTKPEHSAVVHFKRWWLSGALKLTDGDVMIDNALVRASVEVNGEALSQARGGAGYFKRLDSESREAQAGCARGCYGLSPWLLPPDHISDTKMQIRIDIAVPGYKTQTLYIEPPDAPLSLKLTFDGEHITFGSDDAPEKIEDFTLKGSSSSLDRTCIFPRAKTLTLQCKLAQPSTSEGDHTMTIFLGSERYLSNDGASNVRVLYNQEIQVQPVLNAERAR